MSQPKFNTSRLYAYLWAGLLLLVILFTFFPINYSAIRVFLVMGYSSLWLGITVFFWQRKRLRCLPLVVYLLVGLFIVLPSRPGVAENLRMRYLVSLKAYEGTRYLWGGENRLGIDCSGLIRKAFINAQASEGFITANPRLLRVALDLWWHDCSAQALKDGYRQYTVGKFTATSINTLDHGLLAPGDFAVTSDGRHTLAYLGNHVWIEADPAIGKVICVTVPTDNRWFAMPVHILRWRTMSKKPTIP